MTSIPTLTAPRTKDPLPVESTKAPLAFQFIPPAHMTENNPVALTTMMQSLLLDRRHPITLEIVGTAQQRCWLIRAVTSEERSTNVQRASDQHHHECARPE